MSDGYVPPFQVTEEITNLTIEIGQYAGFTTAFEELHPREPDSFYSLFPCD